MEQSYHQEETVQTLKSPKNDKAKPILIKSESEKPSSFPFDSDNKKNFIPTKSRIGNVSFIKMKKAVNILKNNVTPKAAPEGNGLSLGDSRVNFHPPIPKPTEIKPKPPINFHSIRKLPKERRLTEFYPPQQKQPLVVQEKDPVAPLKKSIRRLNKINEIKGDNPGNGVKNYMVPEVELGYSRMFKKPSLPKMNLNSPVRIYRPEKPGAGYVDEVNSQRSKKTLIGDAVIMGTKLIIQNQSSMENNGMLRKTDDDEIKEIKEMNHRINSTIRKVQKSNHLSDYSIKKDLTLSIVLNESANVSNATTERKRNALILLDHDLEFVKDYLNQMHLLSTFTFERLENFEKKTGAEKLINPLKKSSNALYSCVFVFIKFSPRVKEKSLRILKEIMVHNVCYVVKCTIATEPVDLHIDYGEEDMSFINRKNLEHTLILTNNRFDAYTIAYEDFTALKNFFIAKLSILSNKNK